jgi:hypothetical protein
MKFEWDDAKRAANIRKHGIDFPEVIPVFTGHSITFEDTRFNYPEERFVTTGLVGHKVVVVVHTYPEENEVRIISARRATKYERKRYFTILGN